jgi:hypothetical protein
LTKVCRHPYTHTRLCRLIAAAPCKPKGKIDCPLELVTKQIEKTKNGQYKANLTENEKPIFIAKYTRFV